MRWDLPAAQAAFAYLVALDDDRFGGGLPRRLGDRERCDSVGDRLNLRRVEIDIGLIVVRASTPVQFGRNIGSPERGNRHDPDTKNA